MKLDEILIFPDELLSRKSIKVTKYSGKAVETGEKLKNLILAKRGLGVAAIQIGVPLRMFAIKKPTDKKSITPVLFINPLIRQTFGEALGEEGCLSIPDHWIKLSRPKRVLIEAMDEHGDSFSMEFEGYHARGIMHEIDHLDGKLIWDNLPEETRKAEVAGFLAS